MHADDYARLAEQYLSCLRREEYLHYAGLKPSLETGQVAEDFAPLFTREAVQERLDSAADPEGRCLAEFAAHGYLDRRLAPITQRIAEAETSAEVACNGAVTSFRAACRQLALEPDRERRQALSQAVDDCLSCHNPLREERIAAQRALARELGFDSYLHLCEALSGQPLREHARAMAAFLEDSEQAYLAALTQALEQAGLPPREATAADVTWLVLGPRYQACFPRDKLIPSARATLAGLGIQLARQHNLRLDLEPRPHKHPRPFCSPIAVPAEIVVVASPGDGLVDYLSFFHELGHAEHFGHITPELPVPWRLMGDYAVTEAFAFLFQHIVCEPEWLCTALSLRDAPEDLLAFVHLLDFWCLRLPAGRLLYECELHGDISPTSGMAVRYVETVGRAVGARVSPQAYLAEVDDGFYCARYLRAWMLEASLRQAMQQRFGPSWFRSAEAGSWLRSLWRRGTELSAEELAQHLHLPLDTQLLRQRFLSHP
jgi:hypothetical protein